MTSRYSALSCTSATHVFLALFLRVQLAVVVALVRGLLRGGGRQGGGGVGGLGVLVVRVVGLLGLFIIVVVGDAGGVVVVVISDAGGGVVVVVISDAGGVVAVVVGDAGGLGCLWWVEYIVLKDSNRFRIFLFAFRSLSMDAKGSLSTRAKSQLWSVSTNTCMMQKHCTIANSFRTSFF